MSASGATGRRSDNPRTASSRSSTWLGEDAGAGAGRLEPGEPRCGVQPLEELACLREERSRIAGTALCEQPLGVLEPGHGERERRRACREPELGLVETLVDVLALADQDRPQCVKPAALGFERLGALARGEPVDDSQELVDTERIAESERALEGL